MSIRTRTCSEHHCYTLGDCRDLLERMGFAFDQDRSFESDAIAVAASAPCCRGVPRAVVCLEKGDGKLTCIDRTR